MADNFEEEIQEEEADGSDSEESNYKTCSDDDDDDDSEYEEAEESQNYEDAGEEADGDKERPEDDNDAELDMSLNDADDSNVNATDCPICLMSLNGQQLGSPNKCDHIFCFLCISEWSKNSNTCPVDRKKFDYIEVSMTNKGPITKKIKVEDKHVPNDQEWEQAPTYCEVCNRCHREGSMLLCDGCDKGYHLYCLDPPLRRVPLGDWYCDTCLVIRNENNLQSLEGSAVPDLVQELRTSTTSSLLPSIDSTATSSSRGRPSSSRGRGRGRPRSGSTTSTHRRSTSTRGRGVSRRGKLKTKTSKRSKTASTTGKRKRKTKIPNKGKRKTTKKSSAKKRKTDDSKAYHIPFQSSTIPGRTSSDTGRGPGTSTALSIYGDEYALHDFEAEDTVHKDKATASTCSNNNQASTDVLGSIFDCFEVLHDSDARVSRDGNVLPSESPDKKSPSKKPENSPEKSKTSSDVKSHDTIKSEKSRDTGVEQSVQSTTRKKPSTSPEQKHDRNSTTNSTTTDIDKRKNEKDTKQKTVSWSSHLCQQSSPSADPAILPAEEPSSTQKRPCSPPSGDFVPLCKHIKTESSSLSDPYEPPAKPCQKTYSHETRDKSSSSTTLKRTPPLLQEKQEPLHEDLFCSQRTDCQSVASNVATAQSFTDKESARTTTDNNPSSSNTSTDRPTLSSRFSNQSTPTPVTKANVTSHVAGSRVIEFSKKSKELRVNVRSKEQKDPTQPSISSINTHPSLPRLKSFKPVARQPERPKLKELSASFDKPTSMTLDSGYQHHRSRGSHGRPMNSNYEQTNQNLAIIDMLRNKKYTLKAEIKRENSPSTEMDSSNTGYSSIPPACEQSASTCTNVSFHRPKLSSLLAPSSRSSSLPVAVIHPSSSTTTREPDNQAKPPQHHEPQTTVAKPPQQHDPQPTVAKPPQQHEPQTTVASMLPSLSYSQAAHCTMSATEAERLQNRRKGIARLQRLTSIKDTVRLVLQPFYNHHEISRTEFKDIFIRAVQKVNESNSDVNYHRIADLVKKYVKKYKGLRPQLTDLQIHTL